jgi:hypothetical protein
VGREGPEDMLIQLLTSEVHTCCSYAHALDNLCEHPHMKQQCNASPVVSFPHRCSTS